MPFRVIASEIGVHVLILDKIGSLVSMIAVVTGGLDCRGFNSGNVIDIAATLARTCCHGEDDPAIRQNNFALDHAHPVSVYSVP